MASEWPRASLNELYAFSSGLSKPRSEFGSGYPFLSFKDVFYNSAVPRSLTELVKSTERERLSCSVKRGDVFLTRTSETMDELGMSCVALEEIPNATFNGFTKRLRPKNSKTVAPEFARYYFRGPSFRHEVNALSSMSTRASLNNEMLARLTILLPSFDEQESIGRILCSLDDRIDHNRALAANLEAIARALFKSWFVDFDPVRAKAAGEAPPGLAPDLAALFPDRFVDSELGEIPDGWRYACVGQLAELVKGCSYKGAGLSETDGAFMFNLGCFNEKRVFATEKLKRYLGDYREKHAVTAGDLILANTDMTQHREILGRPLLVPAGFEPGFISHHVFKVAMREGFNNQRWRNFLFFALQQDQFRERAVGHATGTTVLALARDSAEKCPVIEPAPPLLAAFTAIVDPMIEMIANSIASTETLTGLRDLMLPRLISGKLRVEEAEAALEAA